MIHQSHCQKPRTPCDANRSRHRYRQYTCRGVSNRIKAFQNLDRIRTIFVLIGRIDSIIAIIGFAAFRGVIFWLIAHLSLLAARRQKPKQNVGEWDIKN